MTSEINDINEIGGIKEIDENNSPQLDDVQSAARQELIRAFDKISPAIDSLSSANLKRILKFTTGHAEVEHLLTGKQPNLSDDEKTLVDKIFEFRSTLYGFYALLKESNEETTTLPEETENE